MKKKFIIMSVIILAICLAIILYNILFRGELYLWEIEVNDKPVYLLGSIHVFKPELYPLIDPKIMDAFNSADLVLFESQAYIIRRYLLEDGETLRDYIPEPYYSEISDLLKSNGINMDDYYMHRPFDFLPAIYNIMAVKYGYWGYYNYGIDSYFSKLCSSRQVRTGSLEPAFNYNDLLEKHVKQDLAGFYASKAVKMYIEDGMILKEEIEACISDWLKAKKLQPLYEDNLLFISDDNSEMKAKLLAAFKHVKYLRNLAMADSIERYAISKGNKVIFAMAGVSHLIGENNIIEILRKKGYKAKRIKRSWVLPF